ncbi:MAG: TerB family tellurite resistance protein [Candidatus Lambdaproteobacteria bacterium]|nr:TerB family tellurite resistance protein [Candidatus Lambdaproteobacteria bacterium]
MAKANAKKLPDIAKHSWQRRRDYLILVAAVAASDDRLHPDELKLLMRWMDDFKLPAKSRNTVLDVARKKAKPALQAIEKRLAATDLGYSLILDMMGMAMADGVLMDDEIMLLRGVAHALEVDPVDFNILIEFVHAAHQASCLSSPEPLYEHSIDSAFKLLHERKISLFAHTLLCVSSPQFDEQLKARWARSRA